MAADDIYNLEGWRQYNEEQALIDATTLGQLVVDLEKQLIDYRAKKGAQASKVHYNRTMRFVKRDEIQQEKDRKNNRRVALIGFAGVVVGAIIGAAVTYFLK